MAAPAHRAANEAHPFHFALLLVGGLCVGMGFVYLYYSFGWPGGNMNGNFSMVGFSGIDNIQLLPASSYAIPLIVVGAICMIIANATAWKETGGY